MGLTRRRAVLAVAALVLAAPACSPDDDTDTTSAETSSERAADEGSIGGSSYLVLVRSSDAGYEVVREDLRNGDEEVVRTSDQPFAQVDVSPSGDVAWAQGIGDETYEVGIAADADDQPVFVDAPDVACPRWRSDGSLLVVLRGDPDRLAIVDPATGSREELVVELRQSVCPAPAGLDHAVYPRALGGETYGPEGAEVVRATLDGGDEEVVGHIPAECWANNVTASPDGMQIAAGVLCEASESAEPSGLYVTMAEEELLPLVAESPAGTPSSTAYQYWAPSWSADATVIAYHRYDPAGAGATQIWTAPVNGGDPESHGPIGQAAPALAAG